MQPASPEAFQLLMDGAECLSQVEANGMKIDEEMLQRQFEDVTGKISSLEKKIKGSKEFGLWKKRFGKKTNLGSRMQLGELLFKVLKHPCVTETATGRPAVDVSALAKVDLEFARDYIQLEKWNKAKSTFLGGIKRGVVDGYLHAFFHSHIARTYRLSSSEPNFQNFPVRDPEIGRMIRSCFVSRFGKNGQIVEVDYSGIEVRIAACYHQDPTMLAYIKDPTKDMHRDMAMECYLLEKGQVSKTARYCAKNMFVFPEFYGSYYIQCAPSLYEAVDTMKLKIEGTDISLKEHLRSKGIKKLGACIPGERPKAGTFEAHIKEVERQFWEVRFPVYTQWKKDWYQAYLKKGYFISKVGFRCQGIYGRNDVLNYSIQGDASHCLVWTMIRLQRWLIRRNMKSRIMGPIHDSIVADVHCSERDAYIAKVKELATVKTPEAWKWIIVPLEVEIEVAPPGGTWFDKAKVAA